MNSTGSGTIAWIDGPIDTGSWGRPEELALPLADRGLTLADGLFETVLVQAGQPRLLDDHLRRWQRSAQRLGMEPPPDTRRVAALVAEAIERSGSGDAALRLNWSRGISARGIGLTPMDEPPTHRFWLQLVPWQPCFEAVRTIISQSERRNPASRISACKTFAYGWAVQARREAQQAGADDALLLNTAGQLCCATTANLLLQMDGDWWTPPLSSGCLPGVMRARGLAQGWLRERELWPVDLDRCRAALLINSLGCRPLQGLPPRFEADENSSSTARERWHQCLEHQSQQQ